MTLVVTLVFFNEITIRTKRPYLRHRSTNFQSFLNSYLPVLFTQNYPLVDAAVEVCVS